MLVVEESDLLCGLLREGYVAARQHRETQRATVETI